jgi:hypothetical protein
MEEMEKVQESSFSRLARRTINSYRGILLLAAFCAFLGVLSHLLLWLSLAPSELSSVLNYRMANLALSSGALTGAVGLFLYFAFQLELTPPPTYQTEQALEKMETAVSAATKRLSDLERRLNDAVAHREIPEERLQEIAVQFFKKASFQALEKEVQEKYGANIDNGVKVKRLREAASESIRSLTEQIDKQRKNANVNMWIGGLLATIGIIVMGAIIYVYYLGGSDREFSSFIMGFIPRLSFVVLIETVAFFFLTLYKEDRNMIRYFRNEITNLEAKYLSLEAAARFDDKESLTKVLSTLSSTERNFTIKKSEKMIFEALKEEDNRLFDRTIERFSTVLENLAKIKGKSS